MSNTKGLCLSTDALGVGRGCMNIRGYFKYCPFLSKGCACQNFCLERWKSHWVIRPFCICVEIQGIASRILPYVFLLSGYAFICAAILVAASLYHYLNRHSFCRCCFVHLLQIWVVHGLCIFLPDFHNCGSWGCRERGKSHWVIWHFYIYVTVQGIPKTLPSVFSWAAMASICAIIAIIHYLLAYLFLQLLHLVIIRTLMNFSFALCSLVANTGTWALYFLPDREVWGCWGGGPLGRMPEYRLPTLDHEWWSRCWTW